MNTEIQILTLDEDYIRNKRVKPFSGIYCIKCKWNKKRYIGKSQDCELAIHNHLIKLRKQKHLNGELQSDFDKYGENQFKLSILLHYRKIDTSKLSITKRYIRIDNDLQELRNQYQTYEEGKGYNIRTGGGGGGKISSVLSSI